MTIKSMQKSWWHIIGLAVVVLFLMFVFKDDVGLSPGREKRVVEETSSQERRILSDAFGLEIDEVDSKTQRTIDKFMRGLR